MADSKSTSPPPSPDGGDVDRPEQTTWIVYTDSEGKSRRITVAEYIRKGL